jgi:hypothetical protein
MNRPILLRLSSEIATDILHCETMEEAVKKAKKFKKDEEYAAYSVDNGKSWHKI